MASKPVPVLESNFKCMYMYNFIHTCTHMYMYACTCTYTVYMKCFFFCSCVARAKWQLGSLSHFVNSESKGYQSLPDFPEEPPDPTVRDVEVTYCTWLLHEYS